MPMMREEYSLCGKIFPYYSLLHCCRCNRLYCRDCIIFTEDREVLCLNCARKLVSPRKLGSKYSSLSRYLARRARYSKNVTITFAQIEGIIGNNLPLSALRYRHWWTNTHGLAQSQAWLNVGWRIHDVNLVARSVTFGRLKVLVVINKRKPRRKHTSIKKPIALVKPRTIHSPSKTRIAKVHTRIRNLERQKKILNSILVN